MATTFIRPIKQTVNLSVQYVMADKVEPFLAEDVPEYIRYEVNEKTGEVTYTTLIATQWCTSPRNPTEDFQKMIDWFGKSEVTHGNPRTKDGAPILAWHLIQSFEGPISPVLANQIGQKLAMEVFVNHPAIIATHTNTGNTHNHILVSAWNLDGKKWNQCHASYRRIRECSDRLCEEHGLPVLEDTRTQRLVRWTDSKGATRYFEPTDRKEQLREERTNRTDVSDYRNTIAYDVATKRRTTNQQAVKQAIDAALPYATSFEHLLFLLREQGFRIRDKKKSGEWLSHITYTPPTAEKGVRDHTLNDDGNYTRERLNDLIAAQNAEREAGELLRKKLNLPIVETYTYGQIDVQELNEDYRAEPMRGGGCRVIKRGDPERTILKEIKTADALVRRNNRGSNTHQFTAELEASLLKQIQESFDNLRFMETRDLFSYSQILARRDELETEYNACLRKIHEATDADELDELEKTAKWLKDEIDGHENCIRILDRIHQELEEDQKKKKRRNREMER